MKFASICLFIVVVSAAIVTAARPGRSRPRMNRDPESPPPPEGSNQAMGDSMGGGGGMPMQDPDAGGPSKPGPPMHEGFPGKKGKGRGRRRFPSPDPSMNSTTTTTSTTQMPSTSSDERTMQALHSSEQHDEKKGEMMSTSTTPKPTKMPSSTTPSQEMNMFPDLDTVEQLQKKQAEEHERIIAVYKSFKSWVDYLRTSIKGGTLNPVLTRRILEDIRAYQQVIMSPHPHRPYNPPHPCDPLRDVWCPEQPGSMMGPPMYKTARRHDPASSLSIF